MREWRSRAVDGRSLTRFVLRGTRRLAHTVVGFLLVCIGLAGLLLPVLPGWLLIIAGFAVLSREYYWASSCLAFCRKHAARGGTKVRTVVTRHRGREVAVDPSGEVVIDLTTAQAEARAPIADDSPASSAERSSRAV